MPERPLTVHCSGLGGGLLSPDHEYDIFFQNHAQMKVYGPSLAMTDDWEQRITQLGLTKTTHEYAVYQLLSTALGWSVWKAFLPGRFADHKLLITRAIRLLTAATIRPAHARPPHPTWVTAVRQILRCYHPQGKRLFLRACFPQYMTVPVPEGMREVDILGFSAGSYTGLAIHEVLNEFACFPGTTKVAAIASPPEMLRLTTGERRVILLHCIEDQLCVWRPDSLTDLSYNIVLIEGHPAWSGRSRHAYGHLLFTTIADGTYHIDHLQITTPQVIPHGVRCEGLLRVLSWVSFDLPDHCKRTLSALLQAAGEGCSDLHTVPCEGRDVRDDPLVTEHDLRQVLIDMIPIPGQAHAEGGRLMRTLLTEFLRGFSLRTLIFLLDMVLPQLDAYHAGRQLQHLQPWISVELAQQHARGQQGTKLAARYLYEAYAGFHVIQLLTEGVPILLFSDPTAVPHASPWDLCAAGNLGSMESNVMAGRALLGSLQLPDGQRRCAIFLVQEKVMQGTSRAADYRAFRRIAPKLLELVIVSKPVALAFCGRLLLQQPTDVAYFDPANDWPQPIELNATFPIVLEQLAFLGDTRSRCELLVFAQANPARLPLTMGILQPNIPVRRMMSERRTKLTDALVRVLCRFLTPIGVALPGEHDCYMRDCLLVLAGHGDGHVLTVAVAMLLAILTGRSDLCIAGVFGAGKTRSLAVLLIALSCELDDFSAVVYTKENVAAKALADQISDLSAPTQSTFGRLLGRIEEGKGEAYATKIDVRCSDRNRIISTKRILIATGGSATAEMAMRYSSFSQWLSRTWLAFMDESQQYGNYHEIAALAAIQQPALIVFVGDHRQTPGGLSKGRAAAANRQKLLHRPLGLRALNRPGDYLPPARLARLVARLWPDASQDNDSDVACLLKQGQAPHTGVWTASTTPQHSPASLARLFDEETLSHLNIGSCLISAILAVLLIATAPEEFGIPECTTTVEAAGLEGPHRWGIILPNSSRVSLLTYKAIVAVRYPELVLHDHDPIQIGHFVPHDHTVEHGGFRTVLWEAPKDLRAAVEDVVVFLNYLQKCHRDLSQGATAQLLVLCNRTAVHNQLLQHGFQAAWFGGLRIATASSAAGATARIAVIIQTGCGFLSGGRRGASLEDREDCYGRATVALTRAIRHTYIVSPIDMAGMIGMAQTLAVYHYGYYTLKNRQVQFHAPAREPSDGEAVLEWGLDTPFTSQDKPPLAVAMVVTLNGVRSLRRYRLVIAQKSKLRLTQEVTAALASHSRDHRLTASGFFPCSTDREYLYGYATDGYRSPLWLCASYNGSPVLVHRLRGNKLYFVQAIKDRRILAIPGIHFFDAHRLQPQLLQAPALQLPLRTSNLAGPEGAGEAVEDPSLDEERATTDGETDVEEVLEDADLPPEKPWCPPIPDAPDDPTEMEIAGAADKLETMMTSSQPQANIFFQPNSLGALPSLWLQAKLTISLTSIQDKFARLFMSIAAELWGERCN